MGTLYFAVGLRGPRPDVGMTGPLVFNMPVKLRPKFMAVVSANSPDPKRKPADDLTDKADGIGLRLSLIDSERPNPGRIVDRRILKAPGPSHSLSHLAAIGDGALDWSS